MIDEILKQKNTDRNTNSGGTVVARSDGTDPGTGDSARGLLPPPKKIFGFTYVSFFVEKTSLPSSETTTSDHLLKANDIGPLTSPGETTRGGTSAALQEGNRDDNATDNNTTGVGGGRKGRENIFGTCAKTGGVFTEEVPLFLRISVHNAKGKLTETQQVSCRSCRHGKMIC